MMFYLAFLAGSPLSLITFIVICLAILIAFISAASFTALSRPNAIRILQSSTVAAAIYCVIIAGIVSSGLLERAFIPNGPLFLVTTVAIAIAVGFAPLGTRISTGVPLAWLVGFHGFRFPLELVLHEWASNGTIPETMTWTGSNWDILSGLMALIVCVFVRKRTWLAWIFNFVGIILLLNVARVAILSSPVPFGWHVEPPLELILYLPYAYIVPICVGGAALGHVLLTRRLLGMITSPCQSEEPR